MVAKKAAEKVSEGAVAAIATAKNRQNDGSDAEMLSTGVWAIVKVVGASLIDEVQARIKDPEVPVWHNPDKGRDEPNPNDPTYLRELAEAEGRRSRAALEAMIMFGIELAEGLPEDDTWLKRLKFLEKRGHLSLEGYDLDDPFELEFLYKRHVAVGSPDIIRLGQKAGIDRAAVEAAAKSFPS